MNSKQIVIPLEDINKLKQIISEHKDSSIVIDIPSNERFAAIQSPEIIIGDNIEYFKTLQNENISFVYENKMFPIKQVLNDELFIQQIANEISSYDFSPLETHIAIYSIVINFKQYNLEQDGTSHHQSRSLYEYLNNNFFCCAGACNLMNNLHHRLNIPCTFLTHNPLKYEEGQNMTYDLETGVPIVMGHATNQVYIKDDKYKIDGYFTSDATTYKNRECALITNEYFRKLLMNDEELQKELPDYEIMSYVLLGKDPEMLKEIFSDEVEKQICLESLKQFDPILYELYKNIDPNNLEDLDKINAYIEQKIEPVPHKNLALLNASTVVKSKIYKNITNEDLQKLKTSYFLNCQKFKEDKLCSLFFAQELIQTNGMCTLSQIEEKYQMSNVDIMDKLIPYIWSDVEDYEYFGSYSPIGLIWQRRFSNSILDNKDVLEQEGFTFKFSYDGEKLLQIKFPKLELENKTINEIIEELNNQKQYFLKYYLELENEQKL